MLSITLEGAHPPVPITKKVCVMVTLMRCMCHVASFQHVHHGTDEEEDDSCHFCQKMRLVLLGLMMGCQDSWSCDNVSMVIGVSSIWHDAL